jgi:hypothetical protein
MPFWPTVKKLIRMTYKSGIVRHCVAHEPDAPEVNTEPHARGQPFGTLLGTVQVAAEKHRFLQEITESLEVVNWSGKTGIVEGNMGLLRVG